jgi:predicted dehydrogenase
MATRREFLGSVAAGTAGAIIASKAKSYARILGANDRVNFAIIGLHGRGYAHLAGIKSNQDSANLSHVCDVDSRELEKFAGAVQRELGHSPARETDFRKVLDANDVDAITIATPDHWHAPMAILGLQAGKHVYVEKPCSHNPQEGEMLIAAQRKYGKLVQMGDQQRSSPHTIRIVEKIHGGLIGRPYLAKSWYCNTRKTIGIGKAVPAPDYLDWDLWQGPAPRRPFTDNIHPYNWHWFWNYGTGETLNNGTHEVDICRWALGVGYPSRINSSGGRYQFKDDWEFYDTVVTSFEYDDKMIIWEGTSCQGKKQYGRDRGSVILGTQGSVLVDRAGYEVYSLDDKLIDEFGSKENSSTADLLSRDSMTDAHFRNLVNAIRVGENLHSPIEEANVAVTMLHLANIGWKVNRALQVNQKDGHIVDDAQAAARWGREYEKGWEIRV